MPDPEHDDLRETAMIQQPFNRTPGIHGGAVTFAGTRVPVSALFACLARGDTIDDFHQDYPGVRPDLVSQALEIAGEILARSPPEQYCGHRRGRRTCDSGADQVAATR